MANDFTGRLSKGFALKTEHDIRNVHGAPGWHELSTPNPAGAAAFLKSVFGWTFETIPMGGGEYTVIRVNGHEVGGIRHPAPGQAATPQWGTYITVEDVAKTAEKAKKAGGSVVIPPTELPGAGKLAGIAHPDGGMVLVFEYNRPFA